MIAALCCVNIICKGNNRFVIIIVVLHCDFNVHILFFTVKIYNIAVQNLFVSVYIFNERAYSSLIMKAVLPALVTLIGKSYSYSSV